MDFYSINFFPLRKFHSQYIQIITWNCSDFTLDANKNCLLQWNGCFLCEQKRREGEKTESKPRTKRCKHKIKKATTHFILETINNSKCTWSRSFFVVVAPSAVVLYPAILSLFKIYTWAWRMPTTIIKNPKKNKF